MLSRLAESLFWIGRYVERAEDTARLLDVHTSVLLEDSPLDAEVMCRGLLAVMGVPAPPGEVDAAAVTELLAFDPTLSASIVSSLTAARENARGARDTISWEVFSCLNRTYNSLPAQVAAARQVGPGRFFSFVREKGAEFHGLTDSTMSRDEGWLFLVLGRSLERVDMTVRLLATRAGQGPTAPGWVTLLRVCGAHEAYLHTYRGPVEARRVAEFLLLDRLFPRSVFAALREAERCLAELEPQLGRAGVQDEARRALGRARSDVEFRRPEELLAQLPAHLRGLQGAVAVTTEALARRFFRSGGPVAWHEEEVPA